LDVNDPDEWITDGSKSVRETFYTPQMVSCEVIGITATLDRNEFGDEAVVCDSEYGGSIEINSPDVEVTLSGAVEMASSFGVGIGDVSDSEMFMPKIILEGV
jgi:hypothetical protein